jgi:hypothetical protein
MSVYRLKVNSDDYVVDTDDGLAAWKISVADAVQRGGGFVTVTNTGGSLTSMLITPNSTVTLHKIHPAGPQADPRPQLTVDEAFAYDDF